MWVSLQRAGCNHCRFWCSQAQLVLQELAQVTKPLVSPLLSFLPADKWVKILIFAFCTLTACFSNKACPQDNRTLIIFFNSALNWMILPQISQLRLEEWCFIQALLFFAVVSLHKANKQNLVSNQVYKMSFYYLFQAWMIGFNTVGAEK